VRLHHRVVSHGWQDSIAAGDRMLHANHVQVDELDEHYGVDILRHAAWLTV